MNINESMVDRGSVPDWIIMLLGALVAVVSLVNTQIPTGWGVLVGVLIVAIGAWDMYRPSAAAVAGEAAAGLLTVVFPWIAGFAGAGIAWLIWILGILIIVGAVWSWASHPTN